jgi:hypothetical protein
MSRRRFAVPPPTSVRNRSLRLAQASLPPGMPFKTRPLLGDSVVAERKPAFAGLRLSPHGVLERTRTRPLQSLGSPTSRTPTTTPVALNSRPRKSAVAHRQGRTGAPNVGAEEDRTVDEDSPKPGGDGDATSWSPDDRRGRCRSSRAGVRGRSLRLESASDPPSTRVPVDQLPTGSRSAQFVEGGSSRCCC